MTTRQPTFFIPHGGGPCFFMPDPAGHWTGMGAFLRSLAGSARGAADRDLGGLGPLGDRWVPADWQLGTAVDLRLLRLPVRDLRDPIRRA